MKTKTIEARAAKAGLAMKDLLERAKINRVTWWRWSTGRFQPRAKSVERIEEILNHPKP